jgi:hypothetical protein
MFLACPFISVYSKVTLFQYLLIVQMLEFIWHIRHQEWVVILYMANL